TDKTILGIRISIERNMLVAEQFIQSLIRKYGKHNISTDGGTWSTSMQIPECGTSLSFFVSKKYYQKNNPIHER
ncbi:MAG TPA: hypothetical protein VIW25_07935, partial [Nitrososphaeraceae archaeon]